MSLWNGCDNIILWGVERALAYNLLDLLQHQNVHALVPRAELKHALKKKLEEQGFDAVLNIEQAYLNDKDGEATLREFSLPQMNSLSAPSGVFNMYPGLKQLQMQSVKCLSPNSLLAAYELSEQVESTLWLEVNGQITSTLAAMIESKAIHLFSILFVFMPDKAWYESEIDAEKLIQRLKQIGYDVSNKNVDLESDQCLYEFTRHPFVLKNKELEQQAKLATKRQTQIDVLTAERDTQAKAVAEKQSQLQQVNQAKEQQAKLATKRQTQIDVLTAERDTQAKAMAEKQSQLQQVNQAKEQQAKLATKLQTQIDVLTAERDTQAKAVTDSHKNKDLAIATLTQEKDELILRLTLLDTEIVRVEAQLELVKDVVLREKAF